jgi:hypothetical protein
VVAEHHHRIERTAVRLRHRGVGFGECQVGNRPYLDSSWHALAFDVGPDHVPVADRDALGTGITQCLDRNQYLVGHQATASRVSEGVGGKAVARILDPRDPLHVRRDQDVHAATLFAALR